MMIFCPHLSEPSSAWKAPSLTSIHRFVENPQKPFHITYHPYQLSYYNTFCHKSADIDALQRLLCFSNVINRRSEPIRGQVKSVGQWEVSVRVPARDTRSGECSLTSRVWMWVCWEQLHQYLSANFKQLLGQDWKHFLKATFQINCKIRYNICINSAIAALRECLS